MRLGLVVTRAKSLNRLHKCNLHIFHTCICSILYNRCLTWKLIIVSIVSVLEEVGGMTSSLGLIPDPHVQAAQSNAKNRTMSHRTSLHKIKHFFPSVPCVRLFLDTRMQCHAFIYPLIHAWPSRPGNHACIHPRFLCCEYFTSAAALTTFLKGNAPLISCSQTLPGWVSFVCEEVELVRAWHMCTFYIQTGAEFAGWARVLDAASKSSPLTNSPPGRISLSHTRSLSLARSRLFPVRDPATSWYQRIFSQKSGVDVLHASGNTHIRSSTSV